MLLPAGSVANVTAVEIFDPVKKKPHPGVFNNFTIKSEVKEVMVKF